MLGWFADFFCPSRRLVVEVDGAYHDTRRDADEVRDQVMGAYGITVLRLKNKDIIERPRECVNLISATAKKCREYSRLDNAITSGWLRLHPPTHASDLEMPIA